ncbi:MAG: MBL fold metallo-hydrolase [Corynebacterium sp.]|nr:MBL fold metallo-hydrolase [Corynebacterium sp.]
MSPTIRSFVAGPFQTNCYIIDDGTQATVIDPGVDAFDVVRDFLDDADLELMHVILTHGHLDHSRDAARLANHYGLPIHIHPADAYMLEGGDGVSEQAKVLCAAHKMVQPNKVENLTAGETIAIAGQDYMLRHAPGHSPGSMLLVGPELCFSGDVVFQGSIGRTDLPGSDPAVMQTTLKEQVLTLPDSLTIVPGHGPATTMAQERNSNPYLQLDENTCAQR